MLSRRKAVILYEEEARAPASDPADLPKDIGFRAEWGVADRVSSGNGDRDALPELSLHPGNDQSGRNGMPGDFRLPGHSQGMLEG